MTGFRTWLVVLAALGCACQHADDAADEWHAATPMARSTSEAVQEQPWSRQIDEVNVGLRNEIQVVTQRIGNAEFAQLAGVTGLVRLEIEDAPIDDQGLVCLAPQDSLQWLVLRRATIGDEGCRHLAKFVNLRILNLPHATFSDEGLRALAELRHLELLRFGTPHVSDEGLAAWRGHPSLECLHLIDVPLADAALDHVDAMSLDSFYLDGSQVSDDRLLWLIKRHPRLHVHRDQRHHDRDPRHGHDDSHRSR